MRIEHLPQVSQSRQTHTSFITPKTGWQRADSIRYGADSSYFWNIFCIIKRKVSNFFRAILSLCLPVKPRAPVRIQEIDYEKTQVPAVEYKKSKLPGEVEGYRYRILLHGVETSNEMIFTKHGDFLFIHQIGFPDQEMREHIGAIFEHMLEEEKANQLGTELIEFAQIFWNAGFTTESKIHFSRTGEDPISQLIQQLIIGKAQEKRDSLNEQYHAALTRIEESIRTGTMDSVFSSFFDLGPSKIALSDLLLLMEAVDEMLLRGLLFEQVDGSNVVKFKKA